MLLTPPLSQTVTPSRTPSPSSMTYFMDGPLYQCIGNLKLRGLARPLNVTQSSYNFAGFTSMPKRNFSCDGRLYLRTFILWDTLSLHGKICFFKFAAPQGCPCYT